VPIIRRIKGVELATEVVGKQTFNTGEAGKIAQKVAPSPGPTVSSVTSAHDVTPPGISPQPALRFLF
jgi:hypothetical protein